MGENKSIDWKVKYDSYEQANSMPLDRAKIEALRIIAEELKKMNEFYDMFLNWLKEDDDHYYSENWKK